MAPRFLDIGNQTVRENDILTIQTEPINLLSCLSRWLINGKTKKGRCLHNALSQSELRWKLIASAQVTIRIPWFRDLSAPIGLNWMALLQSKVLSIFLSRLNSWSPQCKDEIPPWGSETNIVIYLQSEQEGIDWVLEFETPQPNRVRDSSLTET